MKYLVTHRSPDLDAIASVWLIKRFLQGWQDAEVKFVPAGEKYPGEYENEGREIEKLNGEIDIIHVDTGLGKLDHHQTQSNDVCGASLALSYVCSIPENGLNARETRKEAAERMIDIVVDEDHFQEVYYDNPTNDLYDFSMMGLIDGYKMKTGYNDVESLDFFMTCLDALLLAFENKIWAEKEITEKGQEFETRWGKAVAVETMNDDVLKLAQDRGAVIAIRKDPHTDALRIKARPNPRKKYEERLKINDERIKDKKSLISNHQSIINDIDLTPIYEKLKAMDPEASWFFHVSRKMLLNGSSKKPNMKGTTLTLAQVIEVVKNS